MGWTVVAGVLIAVFLVSVASAGEVSIWHAPTSDGGAGSETPVTAETIPVTTDPPVTEAGPQDDSDFELPRWLLTLIKIAGYALAAVAAIAIPVVAWRHRPRVRWRAPGAEREQPFDVLPDIAQSVADDAAEQRAALLRGTPRNAIVECWQRLEDVVAAAGLPRNRADTSTEFTHRVLASYSLDEAAVLTLADLYREARFSTHDMSSSDRLTAVDALDAIHDGLRRYLADASAVDAEPVA